MYHIIVNPASRSGKGLKIWKEQVEPTLRQNNVLYQVCFSEKAGDVPRLAGELVSSADGPMTLVILGGDGTVNEALQGIPDFSGVTLGYIPTGSSNDLARDLKIPTDPAAALELILHSGKCQSMDLGTVSYPDGKKRRFAVSCGIGFDAAVCEEASRSKVKEFLNKIGLGKLTYLGIALKQLFATRAVSAKLTLDDNPPVDIGSILFTACMLHRFEGGGFMFCPGADASDGLLDLCAAGDLSKLLVLFALPTAFKGKHYRFNGITPYLAKKVTIEASSPLWVHTDGEVTRKSGRITVTCEQNALHIIVP
ncbi:MAG: diacylglycerol kinase family lipid kinase [bacterium]|nr:diacylglycerol kinase family lipid kinase [bacterium]